MIIFECPKCRSRYSTPVEKAGKVATCANKACGVRIQVPIPPEKPVAGLIVDEEPSPIRSQVKEAAPPIESEVKSDWSDDRYMEAEYHRAASKRYLITGIALIPLSVLFILVYQAVRNAIIETKVDEMANSFMNLRPGGRISKPIGAALDAELHVNAVYYFLLLALAALAVVVLYCFYRAFIEARAAEAINLFRR